MRERVVICFSKCKSETDVFTEQNNSEKNGLYLAVWFVNLAIARIPRAVYLNLKRPPLANQIASSSTGLC